MTKELLKISRRQVVIGLGITGAAASVPVFWDIFLRMNGYQRGVFDTSRALEYRAFEEVGKLVEWSETEHIIRQLAPSYLEMPSLQIEFSEKNLLGVAKIASRLYQSIGYMDERVDVKTTQIIGQDDQRIPSFAVARACDSVGEHDIDPYHNIILREQKNTRQLNMPTRFETLMADLVHEVGHIQIRCSQPFNDAGYLESSVETASVFVLAEMASREPRFLKSLYYVMLAHAINSLLVLNSRSGFQHDEELTALIEEYANKDDVLDSLLVNLRPDRRRTVSKTKLDEVIKYITVYSLIPQGHTVYALRNGRTHPSLFVPTARDLSAGVLQKLVVENKQRVFEKVGTVDFSRRRLLGLK